MKGILLESNDRVIDLLKDHLKNDLNIELTIATNNIEVEDHFSDGQFDIAIVRNFFPETVEKEKEEVGRKFLDFVYDKGIKIPIIMMGEIDYSGVDFETLKDRFKLHELTSKIIKLLNITSQQLKEIKLPDYVPIPIHYFFMMNSSGCDVYIRIQKDNEDDQYVKRMLAGDQFDRDAIKRYNSKFNLEEFYIRKEDRNSFMDDLLDQSVNKLSKTSENESSMANSVADSYDITQTLLERTGVDEHTIQMAQTAIKAMVDTISSSKKFTSLLKNLIKNEGSYAYKHSFLISIFSRQIIDKMPWCIEGHIEKNFEKLTFASFFHDILLNDDKLVKIQSKEDFDNATLSIDEKELVLYHANRISDIVQTIPKLPSDVETILLQHHGTTTGIGFSDKINSKLSVVSIFFVVIEDFVHSILNSQAESLSISSILKKLEAKYTLPSYRRVVETLKQNLVK